MDNTEELKRLIKELIFLLHKCRPMSMYLAQKMHALEQKAKQLGVK